MQYNEERQAFLDLVHERGATMKSGCIFLMKYKVELVCAHGTTWITTPKKVMHSHGWCHCCDDCKHATRDHPAHKKHVHTDWKQVFKEIAIGVGEVLAGAATTPSSNHQSNITTQLIIMNAAAAQSS